MNIPSPVAIVVFLTVLYLLGILVAVSSINFIFGRFFKLPISFSKTFTTAILGGLFGVVISILIFQFYKPTDVIYGNSDYSEKLRIQNELTGFCVYLPVLTISIFIIMSVIRQLRPIKNNGL